MLIIGILELFVREIIFFLKSRLVFKIFHWFCVPNKTKQTFCLQNKHFINTGIYISERKRCYNAKPPAYYFHMRTNIPLSFRICNSVPLNLYIMYAITSKREYSWFDRHCANTAQKIKFSIKYFLSKCDQVRRKLRIWSHFLKNSLMKNFIFLCSESQLKVSESQRSVKTSLAFTAENIVISPDFMVWKFRGKAQFPQSFERFEKKANKINNVNDILSKHVILIYFYDCYHRFFFFDFIFDINRSFLSLHYVVICQLQPVVKINGGNFNYRIITWEKLMTLLVFITWNYSVD